MEIWERAKRFCTGRRKGFGTGKPAKSHFYHLQAYDTQPPLYHFDAYRLSGAEELYAIGFEDYLRENAFVLVEWANLVEEALPCRRMELHFREAAVSRESCAPLLGEKNMRRLWDSYDPACIGNYRYPGFRSFVSERSGKRKMH